MAAVALAYFFTYLPPQAAVALSPLPPSLLYEAEQPFNYFLIHRCCQDFYFLPIHTPLSYLLPYFSLNSEKQCCRLYLQMNPGHDDERNHMRSFMSTPINWGGGLAEPATAFCTRSARSAPDCHPGGHHEVQLLNGSCGCFPGRVCSGWVWVFSPFQMNPLYFANCLASSESLSGVWKMRYRVLAD